MVLRIWSEALGDFGTNCYIIACPETGEAAVIDPGQPDPWIQRTLQQHRLKPTLIILTHGHLDHIGGVAHVKALTGAPVLVHGEDAPMLTDPYRNGSVHFGARIVAPAPDRLVRDGDTISLGKLTIQVLFTPGHTPGGVSLYLPAGPVVGSPGHLLAGDTLFAGSIGRTDLEGGDFDTLIESIQTKLMPLPPDTVVYPGHGPATTIGDEKEYNPFL